MIRFKLWICHTITKTLSQFWPISNLTIFRLMNECGSKMSWRLTILTGNWIPFLSCVSIYPQYWTAAYTGALSSLSQGNEMNRMNVVCCFQFIYIFPWPFNIVYGPCLLYIKWYHDHNVFTKSYSWNFITTSFGSI